MKIIIAEPNRQTLEGMMECLTREGHIVLASQTEKEALQQFSSFNPDLVVCDAMMASLAGFNLKGACRRFHFRVPVLVVADNEERVLLLRSTELDENYIVDRPVNMDALVKKVNGFVKPMRRTG